MGPLVLTSGRTPIRVCVASTRVQLQWGRWFSPAEGVTAKPTFGPITPASMGPLVLTSGRHTMTSVRRQYVWSLQWGRWFSPAEGEAPGPAGLPGTPRFNGAAGSHQRKGRSSRSCAAAGCASMGPLVLTSGRQGRRAGGPPGAALASMGPLVLTSGRPAPHCRAAPRHVASMGPLVLTSGRRRCSTGG